jgi:hypothetical protein
LAKLVLIGLWACLVTLASSYGATYWKTSHEKAASPETSILELEYKKTKEFNVPKITDGVVQGYIVVKLSYSLNSGTAKELPTAPEAYLLDEAFRLVYSDDSIDFNNLKKYDLQKMTKTLVQNVNVRMNSPIIKDVLIQEFDYVTKSDLKKQL